MNDEAVKHLELIQGVITRLARNSFAMKGWAVILVSAVFALAAKEGSGWYLLVALLPALAFWGLDGYYLRQERLFRKLYDSVRKEERPEGKDGPFSMDTSLYADQVAGWWGTCWSKTIAWLYGPIVVVIVVAAILAFVLG